MHGRVKVRTTAEQEELKKIERAKKLAKYRAGIALIFEKRENKLWDKELFIVTEQMLLQNPDINTLWNIRREAFQNNSWEAEEYELALQKELALTEGCLRENPKSYAVWHQRCWVINNIKNPDWKKELSLCSKCLQLDERNFHCWDYRKFVVEKAKVPDTEEFDFSTSKILHNFSNYSSWHYRSKILSKMFHVDSEELPITEDKHKEELELVMNATFTDPNDSSAWFYQRWLLDNCKSNSCTLWCIHLTKDIGTIIFNNDTQITPTNLVLYVDGVKIDTEWKSNGRKSFDKLWTAEFQHPLDQLDAAKDVLCTFMETTVSLYYSNVERAWLYKTNVFTKKRIHNEEQLKDQLDSYKELAKMEPNNKWALLTSILLMKKISFTEFYDDILEGLNKLCTIDFLRRNYYKDLRSKYILDHKLNMIWQTENELEFQKQIDLSKLDLTTIHNNQYYRFFQEVDLSENCLQNSLFLLSTFQNCRNLSLSNNQLTSLKGFPTLHNLKILSLTYNNLENVKEVLDLVARHNLEKLELRGNPVCSTVDIVVQILNVSSCSLQLDIA